MTATDLEAAESHTVRELDPFAFFAGHASAIKPLGGPERGPDPKYGFHTLYLEYRPGPIIFTIRFHDLKATAGELGVHLNAYVPSSGNNATLVASLRKQMPDVAESGGEISLRINAIAGVTYAVFGYCPDYTDAQASGITVSVQELGVDEIEVVPPEALEATRFGMDAIERPSALVDNAPPSFHDPISQVMTRRQLEEPDYLNALDALPGNLVHPQDRWSYAFVLQALARYGMLEPGARGLALGENAGILATAIMRRGCSVVIGVADTELGDHCPDMKLAPDDALRMGSSIRPINLADLPVDVRGFDFLWSLGIANDAAVVSPGDFIQGAMRTLRPGGIAVHILNMGEAEATNTADRLRPIPRKEIERLALTLIARNYEIAQLNFGQNSTDDGPYLETSQSSPATGSVPFGLIVRRNSSGSRI